jgi:hypothetical protein
MFGRSRTVTTPPATTRPHLELSGPRLRLALENLVERAEELGGVESYVDALKFKSRVFREVLRPAGNEATITLSLEQFRPLCAFMPTVRRRILPWLDEPRFSSLREGIGGLLVPSNDTANTDQRLRLFAEQFPQDDAHRWVRDLGAELLHNVDPERFPLMTRWIWDAGTNTGVLREIWFGENVDHRTIPAGDDYETFLVLREELSQFLADNGVFRDVLHFVDLLCAQVYAGYICEQGGSYLRADFSAPEDPMQHTRRLLGLDGVRVGDVRMNSKTIDGEAIAERAPPPALLE